LKSVTPRIADILAQDSECAEFMIRGMADTMDKLPDEDLLFKLPPDVYAAAKARRKKPN
jgi:hypothetical protein